MTRIALFGLGEVGSTLAEDLIAAGASVRAWDPKLADPGSAPATAAARLKVGAADAREAAAGAELLLSAVTAAQTVAAAEAVPAAGGAFFLCLNSAAPETRRRAAAAVERAGGRYVEAAVMAPIHPGRIAAPMLLGGPHAQAFLDRFGGLGFSGARVVSDRLGVASATKLCRSVIIKGVEALLCEGLAAARHHGVEAPVLASLSNLLPADDWDALAAYMVSRVAQHGTRRAEEMEEAALAVREAELSPTMAQATASVQASYAGAAPADAPLATLLDGLLATRR
jgi:3-hydroxyisobutyrate dehydrogenase-like beta-hydroxyacid dehydrogenase